MAAAIKKAGFSDAAAPLVDDLVSSSGAPEGGKKENEGMDEKNKKNKEKENYLETVMEQTEFSKSYLDPDVSPPAPRMLAPTPRPSSSLPPCARWSLRRRGGGAGGGEKRSSPLYIQRDFCSGEGSFSRQLLLLALVFLAPLSSSDVSE